MSTLLDIAALNRAFSNSSVSNATFLAQQAVYADDMVAFANSFDDGSLTDAELSNLVLTNMGVLPTDVESVAALEPALAEYFAANGNRGYVVLQLSNILAGLGSATGDLAVYNDIATAWGNEVVESALYSSNASSTVPSDGSVGSTYVLTTGVDNIVGGNGDDIINGNVDVTANGGTFNNADLINGGAGVDTMNLTIVDASAFPVVPAVTGVEILNVRNVDGATAMSLAGFAGLEQAWSKSSTADTAFSGASTSTTFGLVGKEDLTVDFASTSGSADTAKLALTGAGTSATARSTVNVSDGNTVEAVSIATSGANYVDLVAGSKAATVTVTGDGTNDISVANLGDVAAVVTLDASSSTGTNTFKVGSNLNTTDTVKGGSGADTLVATFGLATLVKPTVTGVETIKADFDAAATLDLSATTGTTTVTLDGAAADMTVTKADASVQTLNVTSSAAAKDLNFGYSSATKGDLTVNIGTTASTAAAIDLADATFTNTASFTLNTVGTKVYDFDDIDLNGDQTAISINAAADLTTHGIDVTNGDVGSLDVTVGDDTFYSGGLYLTKGDLGDVTYTVAAGAEGQMYLETDEGSIGNVTITGEGQAQMGIAVSGGGSLGDIDINLTGSDASGSYLGVIVSGGTIGDITISVADGANIEFDISGNAYEYGDTDEDGTDGNIGNIMVTIGDDSYVSGFVQTSGGDIGNVSVYVEGTEASGNMEVKAIFLSGDINDDGSADDYVRGGNVGDITLSITGKDANFDLEVGASGGNVGNIDYSVTGDGASGWLGVQAHAYGSGSPGGNIGDVTFTVGDNADAELGLNFDLTVGSIDVTVGDASYAGMYVSGGSSGDAVLSDINVTQGDGSDFWLSVSGFGGDVGNIEVNAGVNADIGVNYSNVSGDIGTTVITAGDGASAGMYWISGGGSLGDVFVTFGDDSSFYFRSSGGSDHDGMGNFDITLGDNGDVYMEFMSGAGDIGDLTFDLGAGTDLTMVFSGGFSGDIGTITVMGGSAASDADIYLGDSGDVYNSVAGVDASAWAGSLILEMDGVILGTTIEVGAGGSTVEGTQGSDNIFGGAGADTIKLVSGSALDEIFAFQKAKDEIDVSSFANGTSVAVADNATATGGTITNTNVYVFADGSNTSTGETIVDFKDLADVAAFLEAYFDGADAGATGAIAVINNGGGAAYVYDLNLTDDIIEADEVTIVGIVNADGALTIANIA
jgi:S-layer protein